MGFGDAVHSGFRRMFDFNGRSGRAEYWWYILAILIIAGSLAVLEDAWGLFDDPANTPFLITQAALFVVLTVGADIRRLHDTGRSGLWWFVRFVPYVGAIILLYFFCQKSKDGPNEYGPPSVGSLGKERADDGFAGMSTEERLEHKGLSQAFKDACATLDEPEIKRLLKEVGISARDADAFVRGYRQSKGL